MEEEGRKGKRLAPASKAATEQRTQQRRRKGIWGGFEGRKVAFDEIGWLRVGERRKRGEREGFVDLEPHHPSPPSSSSFPSSPPGSMLQFLCYTAFYLFVAYNFCLALYSLHFEATKPFDAWFEPFIPRFIMSHPPEPSASLSLSLSLFRSPRILHQS